MQNRDILWKVILEEVFEDFLRFMVPEAEKVFDFKRGFEFLDKELAEMYPEPGRETATRLVDKLVKAFRRSGKEEWLLIHIEVQGETTRRAQFAERMFRYFYRIFDRYRRPVTGIAIFTGQDGRKMPGCFRYEFLHSRLEYRYNTMCILDFTDKELEESDNPFAVVALVAKKGLVKKSDDQLMAEKLKIVRLLYKKGFDKRKIAAILLFLKNYLQFAKPQIERIFEKGIDQITSKKNPMGIIEYFTQEARKEARKEAEIRTSKIEKERFVKALLKNSEFSQTKIASLTDVSVAFVRKVKKNLAL